MSLCKSLRGTLELGSTIFLISEKVKKFTLVWSNSNLIREAGKNYHDYHAFLMVAWGVYPSVSSVVSGTLRHALP